MPSSNVALFRRQRVKCSRFESLMREHFDSLYVAACRLTVSAADAQDLVQEVCLKAFLNGDELLRMEHPRAWLLKVLYHEFVDVQRTRRRSPVDMAETSTEDQDEVLAAANHWQPEQLVEREMQMEAILRAMAYLGQEQCALVALHDIEGLTIRELEEITGIDASTIKSQLYRTRVKLGRLLSNDSVLNPRHNMNGLIPWTVNQ